MKHWMRRSAAYAEIPTHTLWWKKLEPVLAAAIELRVSMGSVGTPVPDNPFNLSPAKHAMCAREIQHMIQAADEVARRQSATPVRSEED